MKDPRQAYTQALSTMKQVLAALRDEPDQEGEITALIQRIEGDRAWLLVDMVCGQPLRRSPAWTRHNPPVLR